MKKLLAFLAASLAALTLGTSAEFPDISITELKAAIAKKEVIVIDVNGASSYKAGHIPTAIDYTSGADKVAAALKGKAKDTLVVAYCGGPACSAYKKGAKQAKELGFTNVKHLAAGISGWKAAGEKLDK